MPRIKQNAEQYAAADFLTELRIRMLKVGVKTDRELAAQVGIAPATLSKRKKDVGGISVEELQGIVRVLRPDPVILLKLLGYTVKDIAKALTES